MRPWLTVEPTPSRDDRLWSPAVTRSFNEAAMTVDVSADNASRPPVSSPTTSAASGNATVTCRRGAQRRVGPPVRHDFLAGAIPTTTTVVGTAPEVHPVG